MNNEFPNNSHRPPPTVQVTVTTPPAASADEEVKLDKVVSGKVTKRKPPLGRRILNTFFSGDSSGVFGYILKEVLVPTAQNLVTDIVTQGVERAIYGEVRTGPRSSRPHGPASSYRPYVSYDKPTGPAGAAARPPAGRRPVVQPSSLDLDTIILAERIDAQITLDKLYETIEKYGEATVGNLNELIGATGTYLDYRFGWKNIDGADIRRVAGGYQLLLPDPITLK